MTSTNFLRRLFTLRKADNGITSFKPETSRSPFYDEARRYCEHMGLTDPADLRAAIRELEKIATQPTGRKDSAG